MASLDRRNFLKLSALGASPFLLGVPFQAHSKTIASEKPTSLTFIGDSERLSPKAFIEQLQKIQEKKGIEADVYGNGGVVKTLESKIAQLTGKEAAIYLPTGTLANQLAIAELSKEKTKVFVPDNSHIFRDEADAAQSVFGKRLIPLGEDNAYFTKKELADYLENLPQKEVFKSGTGAVAIENPVRRAMGAAVPLKEIQKIHQYCKEQQIKMHLDGARLFLASAWTGVSIEEYGQYFDTVYISLYKYLGAQGGAVLSGPKQLIDQMQHHIKIHGGTIYQNWHNAALALDKLESIEKILTEVKVRSEDLVKSLNRLEGIHITHVENGTNIYQVECDPKITHQKFNDFIRQKGLFSMIPLNEKNQSILMMNETLLSENNEKIVSSFRQALAAAL